jgi:large-conductance mechanosensitive channel
MDLQNQTKGFLAEFRAFLEKTNAVGAAIAIAIGFATVQLVNAIVHIVIEPVLDVVKTSDRGFWIWKWDIAALLSAVLTFVATMFLLFAAVKAFNRPKKDEAPKA